MYWGKITKLFFVYDFKIEIQFLHDNLYEFLTKYGLKSRPLYRVLKSWQAKLVIKK